MPYSDPEKRRACHRASDKRCRPRVLDYRKHKRREAKYEAAGGELAYLIAEQARDARTYRVKHGPAFLDVSPVEWVA